MGDVIKLDDGSRIDVASQKILVRLREGGWTYTGELREAAELAQNSQVLYRLEQHLMPAGFVGEAPREKENEYRKFELRAKGRMWMEDREEKLAYPASRKETQEMAYEAVEAAESARESVQNYRKKLHRMRKRVEELEELEEQVEENASDLGYHSGSLQGLRDRKADEKKVAGVRTDLVDFRDEMEEKHEAAVDHLGGRLDAQEMTVGELREEIEELREENEELHSELDELREQVIVYRLRLKMEAMWEVMHQVVIRRILDYFQGKR